MAPGRIGRRVLAGCLTSSLSIAAVAQTFEVRQVAPASPLKGARTIHLSKVSLGQKIRLWSATMINPDCTASGTIVSQILDTPRHGHADISDESFYPNFTPPNPRVACDRQKVPGKVIFYTPDADFHGHDRVVFENANSDGIVRRIIADIDVR